MPSEVFVKQPIFNDNHNYSKTSNNNSKTNSYTQKSSLPKWLIPAIIGGLVLVLGIIVLISKSVSSGNKGYYDGVEWGTSYIDVKEKLGASESTVNDGLMTFVSNYGDIDGLDGTTILSFDKDGAFNKALIMLVNDSSYSNDVAFEKTKDYLSGIYSKDCTPTENGFMWENKVSTIELKSYPNASNNIYIEYNPNEAYEKKESTSDKTKSSEDGSIVPGITLGMSKDDVIAVVKSETGMNLDQNVNYENELYMGSNYNPLNDKTYEYFNVSRNVSMIHFTFTVGGRLESVQYSLDSASSIKTIEDWLKACNIEGATVAPDEDCPSYYIAFKDIGSNTISVSYFYYDTEYQYSYGDTVFYTRDYIETSSYKEIYDKMMK